MERGMKEAVEALDREYSPVLEGFPLSLPREYRQALEAAAERLSPDELRNWAEAGVALAQESLRSWETAAEYFRVSDRVLAAIPFSSFTRWSNYGRELATDTPALATAYFRAAPDALAHLSVPQVEDWGALGRQLYKGTWKSSSLASQFFEITSQLVGQISVGEMRALVSFVDALSAKSYELSAACLAVAPRVLRTVPRADRGPFLNFASVIAELSWADARVYFEKGPTLLHHVHAEQRTRFLLLATNVARKAGRQAYPFFAESSSALGQVDAELHGRLLQLAESLAQISGPAAMEFIKSVPDVLTRIRINDIDAWHAEGRRILESNEEGGQGFFRLESGRGEEVIESLSSRVELVRVSEVLRMYCKAITGSNVSIQSAVALAEKGVGWVSEERASTEGSTVFLPALIETTHRKDENFAIYKVYATHQAGHLEFRSFDFRFERPGAVLGNHRFEAEAAHPRESEPFTDMERFFDLFEDRQLASDLFTIVEDCRIDFLIRREYGGIRAALGRVQTRELAKRRPVDEMPLREAMVENLVRISLDPDRRVRWPASLGLVMRQAIGYLRSVQHSDAIVEDTAEATLALYDLVVHVPNVRMDSVDDWEDVGQEDALDMLASPGNPESGDGEMEKSLSEMPEGAEQPYESPEDVDFRGDFKPELVQLLMRLKTSDSDPAGSAQPAHLTPEQLQELLEKSVEIDITSLAEGDMADSSGMFLSNLLKEAGTPAGDPNKQPQDQVGQPGEGEPTDLDLPPAPQYFFYDEWDFRANDYKPRWCRVIQTQLEEGKDDYYRQTLIAHSGLMTQTRKQFELMKPELFRKIKRLYDGEEFDLDAVIDYAVERRAGVSPNEKVYWRRNKIERDVAVSFLLDMSASTDEEINRRDRKYSDDDMDDDPRRYLTWWAQKKARESANPAKRIIDLEKESIVLLIEALETIGDTYGVFGFSGYGRESVEFFIIKDLLESYGDRIKRRIEKIAPIRSTRMGPAIRHTISKLEQHDAKIKILFLLSDGRPQDHGYGRDRTEKDYAIHDTKMALNEAKRKGIVPFCLTVDRAGHDYLKTMCEDIGYEVVADIESLPSRLPTLYRKLTE
jgi:nitric oxide reductase NorD protein